MNDVKQKVVAIDEAIREEVNDLFKNIKLHKERLDVLFKSKEDITNGRL